MTSVYTVIFYIFAFLSTYIQVFFLVTFLEKRKSMKKNIDKVVLERYPTVTIAVPCYNEMLTLSRTVESLENLDYPKDKLTIMLIDDGSTDKTWELMQTFASHTNIQVFHKENGGKHTALNLALSKTNSEFFSCLDADSFAHPLSLLRIMKYYQEHPEIMAVVPSIIVYEPKNILQKAQQVEYDQAVYNKKMLGLSGGIHVTPGPLSVFKKKVFDDLGPYRKAHNTEDQEIALRMQMHGYQIDHCPEACVYTMTPPTVYKLYRQRLRWVYGFLKNLQDYRKMMFNKDYGTVAFFTLPSGLISIISVVFIFSSAIYNLVVFITNKFIKIQTVGLHRSALSFKFDWFFINTEAIIFMSVILYTLLIVAIVIGRNMAEGKKGLPISILYYIIIYMFIAPFWLLRAVYNAIFSKESSWVLERNLIS